MKKIFSLIAVAFLIGIFFVSVPAHAAGFGSALGKLDNVVGEGGNAVGLSKDLSTTIGAVVKGALALVGTLFLVLTVYAGILWMTASGKEEQIETAKKIITATIIGLFITMSAYTITYFVTSRLGA